MASAPTSSVEMVWFLFQARCPQEETGKVSSGCTGAAREQLRFAVATLNWLSLGSPVTCPPHARCGSELSCSQHRVLDIMQRRIEHFLRPGSVSSSAPGRVEEKCNALYSTCLELPVCSPEQGNVDRELGELVSTLKVGWGYSGFPNPAPAPAQDLSTSPSAA